MVVLEFDGFGFGLWFYLIGGLEWECGLYGGD